MDVMMIGGGFTVLAAMVACGVNDVLLFQDMTQAARVSTDIFGYEFAACMDITFKELDEYFKNYGDLTVAQGQIRFTPGTRKNIKAFVQWTRDEIRLGRDPQDTPFPVVTVSDLIRRYKTHEKFQSDAKTLDYAGT